MAAMAAGIVADGDIDNVIDHTFGSNGGIPTSYSEHGHRFIFSDNVDGYAVDYGALQAPTQMAYLWSDSGDITLSGKNIVNDGGEMSMRLSSETGLSSSAGTVFIVGPRRPDKSG